MPPAPRPHVVLQMSASIDGRIAFAPGLTMFDRHPAADLLPDASPLWNKVSAAIDAAWHPGGTLMGSGTVIRVDAPLKPLPEFTGEPASLHTDFLPDDILAQTSSWALLVDGRGRCRSGFKATQPAGNHILHLVSHAAPPAYLAFLRRERIPYLIGGETHADLPAALHKLSARLGLRAVKLWGGGTLNGAMFRHGLVDEIHLIVQPAAIGGRLTPTLIDCADLQSGETPAVLELVSASHEDGDYLWLHYRVKPSYRRS